MSWSTFDSYQTQLSAPGSVFVTCAFDPETSRKFLLPNIQCEEIRKTEGAVPPTATFKYLFDTTGRDETSGWPRSIAEVWSQDEENDYILLDEEEIIVYEMTPDGERILVFHGTVKLPQVNQGAADSAAFTAIGIASKLWNGVIEGSYYRDGDEPEDGEEVFTIHDAWFNPRGLPNKTPDDFDQVPEGEEGEDAESKKYPLFLDPRLKDTDEEPPQDFWDLGGFVRYLAWKYNGDEKYVKNPISSNDIELDTFLQAIAPKGDGDYFDLEDESTYDRTKIIIRSLNVANKPWIEAVEEQLKYHGFYLFFVTTEDDDENPETKIVIFRKDGLDGSKPVSINMPEVGSSLLDGLPDADAIDLVRDRHSPVNEWIIQTSPVYYEVSFILCPLFPIAASDASDSFIATLKKSALATATAEKRKLYRLWGLDECGAGHWKDAGSAKATNYFDFNDLFGKPANDDDPRLWAVRYRPGQNTLLSLDTAGVPRKAELAISTDYTGDYPAIWNRQGTWRSLGDSSWNLLKDQCGIEIIADNPDRWTIPTGTGSGAKGDVVRAVKSLAAPDDNNKRIHLRLTVVIQSDHGLTAVARRRDATPVTDTVRRSVDGKDHYRKYLVHKSSIHNSTGDYKIIRDDSKDAKAKAEALRGSHEFPATAGGFNVPWISHAFGVGHLIDRINGRDLDLSTNAGKGSGESPYYPTITGFTYRCQEPQGTYFELSDRRSETQRA